jgi:S-layer homology domain
MKRLASLVVASSFALGTMLSMGRAASATPFSDVPANHWAYQYIQSLAADGIIDGYPDGKFKGDRPLTRYEMAVVVARVIAKLQENEKPYTGPTKQDLDKLQKLIDALKDELDELGVRVTNLEDALDALDKRTKFAQSLSMHGTFLPDMTFRQRPIISQSVNNGTGATVATYYGASAGPGLTTTVDPFVTQFMTSDDSNNPLTAAGSGIQIRQDSRFSLSYQFNDNLTISLPVHILNFEYGGEFSQQAKVDIEPGIDVTIGKAGNITNLDIKFGIIDNMPSSLTGLAFRAPFGYSASVPYEQPYQPYQKGAAISGTLNETNFGSTQFWTSFTRVDDVEIDTQTAVLDPTTGTQGALSYLYPIVAPQYGYVQTGAAQALRTDTFNSGTGTLTQVFLTQKAIIGSVYVSYYNGTTYNNAGTITGGPPNPLPAITYNDAYNAVVFGTPLPAGSTVSITYRGITASTNTNLQRYMANARMVQKFSGLPGAQIGLQFNRVFDFDDTQTTGDLTQVFQAGSLGLPLVSDTVFGLDGVLPLPVEISGKGSNPVLFGELAFSKYTPDYRNVPAVGDTGGVVGLRLKIAKLELSGQYQSIGTNFFDGAPFRYYGNPPAIFSFWKGAYFPDFFGFANNQGINQQFDAQFPNGGFGPGVNTATNPNLTFLYPVFNPLKANSPTYYSSFSPNSQGPTVTANTTFNVGDVSFNTRGQYQHLQEIRPDSFGNMVYGPAYASSIPLRWDNYTLASQFSFPAFGQKISANVSGTYENLRRNDTTAFQYYPINPTTQTFDPTAFLAAQAIPGGSLVSFYPNYVNMRHEVLSAGAAIPLTKGVGLNLTYSTQRYGGSYGTTLNQNISERKDFYTGSITYQIPNSNSSLQFQTRNYKYVDDVIPNFNMNEYRQDLFFTVRF